MDGADDMKDGDDSASDVSDPDHPHTNRTGTGTGTGSSCMGALAAVWRSPVAQLCLRPLRTPAKALAHISPQVRAMFTHHSMPGPSLRPGHVTHSPHLTPSPSPSPSPTPRLPGD